MRAVAKKMWLHKVFMLIIPAISNGLHLETVDFATNYFKERQVKYVCLLSCGNQTWDINFTKASAHSISVSSTTVVNISDKSLTRCLQHRFKYIGVLLDASCGDLELMFYTASINRWLDFKHIWLVVDETNIVFANKTNENSDSETSSTLLQILNYLNISVDADIVVASKYGDKFKLTDVFNFGKVQGGHLITTDIGFWAPEGNNKQIIQILNMCKYHKRYDFQQIGIRSISITTSNNFDPRMLTDVRPVKGVSTITRTSTIILNELAQIHNFRLVFTKTDKWLGSYSPNSSRAAATGLFFQEQDISSVFRYLDILFDRVTLIHPSLTNIETRYYYRIPTTGPGKFENQFLRPLSAGTWLCLLAVSTLCTVILVLVARWESRPSSFQYGLFSVTAIVCQQFFEDEAFDRSITRISAARKITTFVIGMSGVLVYNFYTSSVVSWLLNGPPPSYTSLWELQASPLELIFEDVGYTHSWLTVPNYYFNRRNKEIEDVIRRRVRTRKRDVPLFMPVEEGIAKVKAGGYAYLTEPFSADPLISATFDQGELCELDSLTSIEKVTLYPGVQLNSPYKEFFTWSLTRLQEKGIISSIQRRTNPPSARCEGSSPRALALGGAAPAFILLAGGYLVATCIMFAERFIHQMKRMGQYPNFTN